MAKTTYDAQLATLLASCIQEDQAAEGMRATGPHSGRLADVLTKLRALNIPWTKILALIGPIIQILTTGTGDWSAIIAAILALFGKTEGDLQVG